MHPNRASNSRSSFAGDIRGSDVSVTRNVSKCCCVNGPQCLRLGNIQFRSRALCEDPCCAILARLARPIPAAPTDCRDGVFCPGLVDRLNMLDQLARNTILALPGTFPRNVQSQVLVDDSRPGCAHRQFWFHFNCPLSLMECT